jgi:Mn-dependent DtxR family transcriptional regulator
MTQELISNMLGVRRPGVTEAARKLQAAGVIEYSRGQIKVSDRAKLEAHACECYSAVKKETDRLDLYKTP